MPRKYSNIQLNQEFDRLTVIAYHHTDERRKRFWECLCVCGNMVIVPSASLNNGHTRSCGCIQREHAHSLQASHGMSASPEYRVWITMRARCQPEAEHADCYYERGIGVCSEWNDFAVFYAHVGLRPTPIHTLERINNDKGYEPENVRWATRSEQAKNTRQNVWITFHGVTLCKTDWARKLRLSNGGLRWRLKHWPLERALAATAPKT